MERRRHDANVNAGRMQRADVFDRIGNEARYVLFAECFDRSPAGAYEAQAPGVDLLERNATSHRRVGQSLHIVATVHRQLVNPFDRGQRRVAIEKDGAEFRHCRVCDLEVD